MICCGLPRCLVSPPWHPTPTNQFRLALLYLTLLLVLQPFRQPSSCAKHLMLIVMVAVHVAEGSKLLNFGKLAQSDSPARAITL